VAIGAFHAAEVAALVARIDARDEKRHARRLRCRRWCWLLLRLREHDHACRNERD
jgi:hypothetical protein